MDSPEREPEIDLSEIERDLRRLKAGAIAIDRDRLLFEAGRASQKAEHRGRLTTVLALTGFVLATGFGGLFVRERNERLTLEVKLAERDRAMLAPRISADPPDRRINEDSYLALRRNLLAGSLESRRPIRSDAEHAPSPAIDRPPPEPFRARGSDRLIPL